MEAIRSSETSVLTRATGHHIPENGILYRHRREHLKSYMALTGWTLQWRGNVSPVKYELGSYIAEDAILHSHRRDKRYNYTLCMILLIPRYLPSLNSLLTRRYHTLHCRNCYVRGCFVARQPK
jgi:hypothetical protein